MVNNAFMCVNYNCRDLFSKLDLIQNMLHELKIKPLVITFTESWSTPSNVNLI